MKKILLLFISVQVNIVYCQAPGSNQCDRGYTYINPANADFTVPNFGWHLDFEDDFNGTQLDANKWENHYGWGARQNGSGSEQEYYTDGQNMIISNGTLKLTAKSEYVHEMRDPTIDPYETLSDNIQNLRYFNYTSGMISSKRKFSYGKYEIMCKIPDAYGAWPAFWTFGDAPAGGTSEIDCFEFYKGNFNRQGTNLHRSPNSNTATSCGYDTYGAGFTTAFHLYGIVYTEKYIEWYRDNVLIRRADKYLHLPYFLALFITGGAPFEVLFNFYAVNLAYPGDDSQMRIIANLAVETEIINPFIISPYPMSQFYPCTFEIDYIRHYSHTPCSSNPSVLTGAQLNNGLISSSAANSLYSFNQNDLIVYNLSINNSQNLQLRACNTIAITDEFEAVEGCDLLAKADAEYCCTPDAGYRLSSNNGSTSDSVYSYNRIDDFKTEGKQLDQNSNTSSNEISIQPNPNNGSFSVETHSLNSKNVKIMSNLGIIVHEGVFNESTYQLDLNLNNGLYYIEIFDGVRRTNQILIIEN